MQGSVGLDLTREYEPDLILLDLNLPDIYGGEVVKRSRRSTLTIAEGGARIPIATIACLLESLSAQHFDGQ